MSRMELFDLDQIPIPAEATWDDILVSARTCPVLYQAVMSVERGDLTREQALIRVALWAANERRRVLRQEIDRLNMEIVPRPIPFDPYELK